jgi:GNAT superfamily N-acetyltransferase
VSAMKDRIALRPATTEDEKFVDDLVFTTMRDYVEATWPSDSAAQRHYYEINKFNPSNTRILQVDGKDVGRLSTTVREDCVFVDELHILPEYQRRGIGRQAIEQVFREAREKNLPVKATVLKVNQPSLNLCLSMGFEVVAEVDHRFHIQYLSRR